MPLVVAFERGRIAVQDHLSRVFDLGGVLGGVLARFALALGPARRRRCEALAVQLEAPGLQ